MNVDFNQIKERVLPYFIEIYGEEFKDIITARIEQIVPVFYSEIESKQATMQSLKSAKRVELTFKLLEHYNVNIPAEVKAKAIKYNSTYELSEIPEASSLLMKCFNGHTYNENAFGGIKDIVQTPTNENYIINQSIEALKNFGVNVLVEQFNDWVVTDEAKQVFQQINQMREYISVLDAEFNEFVKQFENLQSLIDKSREIERNIKEKYMLEFLQSISKYMVDKDQKLLAEYLASSQKDWYSFIEKLAISQVVGSTFTTNGLIESFGTKADAKMNSEKISGFEKQTIVDDRIKYYTLIGLYKSNMSPEKFLASEVAIKNAPPQKFIDAIISQKEKFAQLAYKEFLELTSSYKDNLELINSLGLATEVDFSVDVIKSGVNCINPNLKIVGNAPTPVSLLFFTLEGTERNSFDVKLIHEINHTIELSLTDYIDGKSTFKCGFETIKDDEKGRPFEAFSEVINQIIAMEITDAMHKDGVYLFDDPNLSQTRGTTSYENQLFLVQDFWQKFRKEIMMARTEDNLDSLFQVVGQENFNKLNDIVSAYSSLPYFELLNNKEYRISKRKESLLQATEVIDKMLEYAKGVSPTDDLNPSYK